MAAKKKKKPREGKKRSQKGGNNVNPKVDKKLALVDIKEVPYEERKHHWKIKALATEDHDGVQRSEVVEQLVQWKRSNPKDWKRIKKSLEYVAENEEHHDQSKVQLDRKKRPVFEIRANRCVCRLMAFRDPTEETLIICALPYSKGSGHNEKKQDMAFAKCDSLREAYLRRKPQ